MNLLLFISLFVLLVLCACNCVKRRHDGIFAMQQTVVHDGNSHRLGNLIDAWYFGSLGSSERRGQFSYLNQMSSALSFGRFLSMDASLRTSFDSNTLAFLTQQADAFWASYHYSNLIQCIEPFHTALRSQMNVYASSHRPALSDAGPYDCVIHYRVGDFLALGQLIHPESVADACATLDPRRIGIMDGGMAHNTDDVTKQKSLQVKEQLKRLLRVKLPLAHIEDCPSGDVDLDFFTCANAPSLVTAGGSFAICAAVACKGVVRTPACKNTNFCERGHEEVRQIRPGWKTYEYEHFFSMTVSRKSLLVTSPGVMVDCRFPEIAKFENIHSGEMCVLLGTGETLKDYIPIANAIHLTSNHFGTTKFCSDRDLIADYYFLSDKPGLDKNPAILTYRPKKAKFYGRFQHNIGFGPIPSYQNRIDQVGVPYIVYDNDDWIQTGKGREHEWTLWQKDLSQHPFGGTITTMLKVFQFALYCGFNEIVIVGCDCNDGYGQMVENWKVARQFANDNYSNANVRVLRPKNLKNIFEEYVAG